MHYVNNNNTGQQTLPLYANPPPKAAQADGGGGAGHPLPNNPRQPALNGQNLAPRNNLPPEAPPKGPPMGTPQFPGSFPQEPKTLATSGRRTYFADEVGIPLHTAKSALAPQAEDAGDGGNAKTPETPKQEAPLVEMGNIGNSSSSSGSSSSRDIPDYSYTTSTKVPVTSTPQAQPDYTYTTSSQMPKQEAPLVEMGNIGNSSSSSGSSSSNTIKVRVASKPQTQPDYTYTTSSQMPIPTPVSSPIAALPQAHLSNVAHTVPGMNLSGPTGDVANMAFQAGAEGTQMAETGMTAGMGQLGQVMTLGIKQQVEMALMKQATDIAGAVAKELRNVSKNVKDMAGS